MLASLEITLRRFPALESFEHSTRAISKFLGPPPNLLLSEACKLGSIATLDWIWAASCATVEARTPGWSLTNYLRSDPHYYRWQFAKSLHAAAERGDLESVEWLFEHFSGCEAPVEVVNIAARNGNLRVLRFLWAHRHRSGKKNKAAQTERLPRGDAGVARDCAVRFGTDCGDGVAVYWGEMVIAKAVANGQIARCLDDGMPIVWNDRVTAIKEALRLSNVELAERLVPSGRCMLQYATDCAQPEVIEKVLSAGFLQWDEERAATAFKNLAESGSCDLMQQIFQLHSPVRENDSRWKSTWREALKAACSGGNTSVLKWLMEHSLGSELYDEMKQKTLDTGFAMRLFHDAATKGHIEVMEYLYEKNMAFLDRFTKHKVIRETPLNSVKWLVDHDVIGDGKQITFSWAIDNAARFGRLDILQLFQTLDEPGGYEAAGLKRLRTGPEVSLWRGDRDTTYWAAEGGHVDVLEWVQENYPDKCGADAMDAAAIGGHLDAVKWLHTNRTEGCTTNALYRAAEKGHFEVVKWLYANRPESRTSMALIKAFRSEHFRIAYWLHSKYPDHELSQHDVPSHKRMVSCRFPGKPLEALLFLRAISPSIFTEKFVKLLRKDCSSAHQEGSFASTLVLRWLDENNPSTAAATET